MRGGCKFFDETDQPQSARKRTRRTERDVHNSGYTERTNNGEDGDGNDGGDDDDDDGDEDGDDDGDDGDDEDKDEDEDEDEDEEAGKSQTLRQILDREHKVLLRQANPTAYYTEDMFETLFAELRKKHKQDAHVHLFPASMWHSPGSMECTVPPSAKSCDFLVFPIDHGSHWSVIFSDLRGGRPVPCPAEGPAALLFLNAVLDPFGHRLPLEADRVLEFLIKHAFAQPVPRQTALVSRLDLVHDLPRTPHDEKGLFVLRGLACFLHSPGAFFENAIARPSEWAAEGKPTSESAHTSHDEVMQTLEAKMIESAADQYVRDFKMSTQGYYKALRRAVGHRFLCDDGHSEESESETNEPSDEANIGTERPTVVEPASTEPPNLEPNGGLPGSASTEPVEPEPAETEEPPATETLSPEPEERSTIHVVIQKAPRCREVSPARSENNMVPSRDPEPATTVSRPEPTTRLPPFAQAAEAQMEVVDNRDDDDDLYVGGRPAESKPTVTGQQAYDRFETRFIFTHRETPGPRSA
ncbi:hypothetical protein SPBR_08307 [Sporothrix brasiliensis 5110]|uniref:Uncharacterized protein n=1 Tax=Sporothrix brasiliensis 5110 TaxID=1398154 RepID=A0A0C2IND4_9PEZI|nr:uncharacterized protein SPBR_08307 [Sporothrix brasiliensis 5110]KIH86542.1 hypothetical protein SPBR_08307 [Sporothrix brasiliensis 5110]